jgi:hypothetical protein
MKKTTHIIIFLLTVYFVVYNFNYLNIVESYHPYFKYMENPTIRFIYITAIILDLVMLISIIMNLFESNTSLNKIVSNTIILSSILVFLLVIFEMYFGSTFYYGEVRDKQGFPFGVNNFGFLSTTIFFCYSFFLVYIPRVNTVTKKIVSFLIFFCFLLIFQYFIFQLLKNPWQLT